MDDFLGTSIQFAERQLILLEQQHAADLQKTVEELIASGFLESDYEDSTDTESESEFEYGPEPELNDEIGDNSKTEIDETIPLSTDNRLCSNILFAFIIGLLIYIYNNKNNMYKYNTNTSYYSTTIYYTPLLNGKEYEYSVLNDLFMINVDNDSNIDSFVCDFEYKLNIIGRCVYNNMYKMYQNPSSHVLHSDTVNYTNINLITNKHVEEIFESSIGHGQFVENNDDIMKKINMSGKYCNVNIFSVSHENIQIEMKPFNFGHILVEQNNGTGLYTVNIDKIN